MDSAIYEGRDFGTSLALLGRDALEAIRGCGSYTQSRRPDQHPPDGRFLLTHDTKTFSIILLSGDHKPKAVYSSTFIKDEFHLSRDGQLIAYGENRNGRWEVFVASFASFHYIIQVSVAGGSVPNPCRIMEGLYHGD